MKRTPDAISKKKQEISQQIDQLKRRVYLLNQSLQISGISNKIEEIEACEALIQEHFKTLSKLYRQSKHGHITFKNVSRLQSRVY